MLNAEQILDAIKRRRNQSWDSQTVGSSNDPLAYTAADVSRAIADEYDSLLKEIGAAD